MHYWSYYDEHFHWESDPRHAPNIEATRNIYSELGLSDTEASALIDSGYVNIIGNTIIDRYYGGALLSSDGVTRLHKDHFLDWYDTAKSNQSKVFDRTVLMEARSLRELEQLVSRLQEQTRQPLLFRGQTKHYRLERKIPNPHFLINDLGEPSLIPSVWRRMLPINPLSFHSFEGLSIREWSRIILSQFDMSDIERRVLERRASGEWMYSAQDMEDSDDPVLHLFGKVNLDLAMGVDFNLADLLNTLLQHYGLLSTHLDLTSDIETALYFLSHKFSSGSPTCSYQYVGCNADQSVLYVFRRNDNEMASYTRERVLHNLTPLRPERQACVTCRSGPFALNLPALYLLAIVQIRFEPKSSSGDLTMRYFPTADEDHFLKAMAANCLQPGRLTHFK